MLKFYTKVLSNRILSKITFFFLVMQVILIHYKKFSENTAKYKEENNHPL